MKAGIDEGRNLLCVVCEEAKIQHPCKLCKAYLYCSKGENQSHDPARPPIKTRLRLKSYFSDSTVWCAFSLRVLEK